MKLFSLFFASLVFTNSYACDRIPVEFYKFSYNYNSSTDIFSYKINLKENIRYFYSEANQNKVPSGIYFKLLDEKDYTEVNSYNLKKSVIESNTIENQFKIKDLYKLASYYSNYGNHTIVIKIKIDAPENKCIIVETKNIDYNFLTKYQLNLAAIRNKIIDPVFENNHSLRSKK